MRVKTIVREFLYGLVFVIVVTISEFLVTLPFGTPWDSNEPWEITPEIYRQLLNREFLLTSIPVVIIIFIFLKWIKTKEKVEAIRRGSIWTGILALNYIIVGLGNDNFKLIFSTIGIYVLLGFSMIGTIFYTKYYRLK